MDPKLAFFFALFGSIIALSHVSIGNLARFTRQLIERGERKGASPAAKI